MRERGEKYAEEGKEWLTGLFSYDTMRSWSVLYCGAVANW